MPFAGVTRIVSVEMVDWQGAHVVLDDPEILVPLEATLRRMTLDALTACPFWNRIRLETDGGRFYGALTHDGCPMAVLAASSAALDSAWGGDRRSFLAAVDTGDNCYMITEVAYALLREQAELQGASLTSRWKGQRRAGS